jgi:hypothetical protein
MEGDKPSSNIDSMPGPLSEALWSPDFVMQAIEVLPVSLRRGRLWSMRPEHADSFVVAWPASARPEEVAEQAMVQLGLEPAVLHSTSWRHADKEVVVTYIAVVSPDSVPPPSWQNVEVARSELARGDATAPPSSIGVMQVQEHALRHLAWLRIDDPTIASLLEDWADALSDYVPEPFRALGGPPM